MSNTLSDILVRTYEIEGLLHTLAQHGEDTPTQVLDALRDKAHNLAEAVDLLTLADTTASLPPVIEPEPAIEPTPVDEPAPVDEPVATDEPETPIQAVDDAEESERDIDDVDHELFGSAGYMEPAKVASATPDRAVDTTRAPEQGRTEPMRIDEKLQRTLSKDLRKAFSLNDRFRFQRELFGGNAREMDETLTRVEHMDNYNEAEDYFYSVLGWDGDNSEVAQFMNIIRLHLD